MLLPHVLLLDEPLGALDRQLRKAMQTELRRIQREVEMTFLYVTHDQDEALSMSDRIAVMRPGRYRATGHTAGHFSDSTHTIRGGVYGGANIFTGRVLAEGAHVCLETPSGLRLVCRCAAAVSVGASLSVVVRPDVVQVINTGGRGQETTPFPGE